MLSSSEVERSFSDLSASKLAFLLLTDSDNDTIDVGFSFAGVKGAQAMVRPRFMSHEVAVK